MREGEGGGERESLFVCLFEYINSGEIFLIKYALSTHSDFEPVKR